MLINSEEKNKIGNHLKERLLNYVDIFTDEMHLCIENRPPYCDRGRWIVKAFSPASTGLVDSQDAFPRYYYDFISMITELNECFKWKKQKSIKKIKYSKPE